MAIAVHSHPDRPALTVDARHLGPDLALSLAEPVDQHFPYVGYSRFHAWLPSGNVVLVRKHRRDVCRQLDMVSPFEVLDAHAHFKEACRNVESPTPSSG